MHNDYDLTNREIEKRLYVKIPNSIKAQILYKEGFPKILNIEEIIDFIKNTANINLEEIKKL